VASVDEVALHHQSWGYGHSTDLQVLAGAIVAEIARWLGQFGCEESPPATTDDQRS
jgi:hypothetical protein